MSFVAVVVVVVVVVVSIAALPASKWNFLGRVIDYRGGRPK